MATFQVRIVAVEGRCASLAGALVQSLFARSLRPIDGRQGPRAAGGKRLVFQNLLGKRQISQAVRMSGRKARNLVKPSVGPIQPLQLRAHLLASWKCVAAAI
jgi:hypothetical protein